MSHIHIYRPFKITLCTCLCNSLLISHRIQYTQYNVCTGGTCRSVEGVGIGYYEVAAGFYKVAAGLYEMAGGSL